MQTVSTNPTGHSRSRMVRAVVMLYNEYGFDSPPLRCLLCNDVEVLHSQLLSAIDALCVCVWGYSLRVFGCGVSVGGVGVYYLSLVGGR